MNYISSKIRRASFCLAGFLFALGSLDAQYAVSGEVLEVGDDYHDVEVHVSSNNSSKKINLSGDGRFFTSLDWNKVHHFSFRKEGFVSKVIEFSTIVPENQNKETLVPYFMQVRLFEMFDGVDTVFFNNPIAKIRYESNISDFEDDRDYSLSVRHKINQMKQRGTSSKQSSSTQSIEVSTSRKTNMLASKNDVSIENNDKQNYSIEEKTFKGYDLPRKIKEMNGIPPLKKIYPRGETVEDFTLSGKDAKRTVFMFKNQRRVFLFVKHDWGGKFFFIDEADIGYRCISEDVYLLSVNKYREKINK